MGAEYDMTAWQKTTLNREFVWTDSDDSPVLLHGYSAYLQARRGYLNNSQDDTIVIDASTDNGKIILENETGKIKISLDENDLDVESRKYYYDLLLVSADTRLILLYGSLRITPVVTNA